MRNHFGKTILFVIFIILFCTNLLAQKDEKKVEKYLNNQNFVWKNYDTQNFRIYVEENSFAEENVESLKNKMEEIRTKTLLFMGESFYPKKTFAFLLSSRERMKILTGNEFNGLAFPSLQTVFMVYSPTIKAVGNHEPFHLFAWNLWKSPKLDFISEGMAVYSDDKWHSYPLHPLAKYLKDNGKLISFKILAKDFKKNDDLITYPQSGSFLKFLSEKYGKEKIKEIWRKGEKNFRKIYSKDLETLEKEWLDFLDKQDASKIKYLENIKI